MSPRTTTLIPRADFFGNPQRPPARSVRTARCSAGSLLRERSPLHQAQRIRTPLLIAQGANDPRVKQAEADQMATAMRANGIPLTNLLFPDEGHGFARPANNLAYTVVAEAFLARRLGGRAEPIAPAELAASSIEVRDGAALIDGLDAAPPRAALLP